ncbi:MAG: site-specific DNA-methyltransferase [Rhodoferax sp.]|uniref:site-specific DNA-methyltransferase n=1 Tax=Rhodoferax sp. TaxID=50421 RepID=UPI0014002AF0|nr:site-specific DNA-methyltransferase [Rhodoferax sp.]NDP39322.1 site-specific DNA-methyltransferase [Rhodoferax sp.]
MPTLDWLNRPSAFTLAARVPYRLLEQVSVHTPSTPAQASSPPPADTTPVQAELVEAPTETATSPIRTEITDNLLIQGDNLEALKALLPFYRGQVKCIFIDPPYNTKSAFEHYDDNLEHAQWLSMMLPRLQLLRELLREDGSIWVTIDDNEGHYLKVLMDEVFGRGNFVANVVWQKKYSPQNDAEFFSAMHDHVFVYAKNTASWSRNLVPRTAKQDDAYKNPDDDPRGIWKASDLTRAEHRDRDFYAITTPSGKQVFPARGRSWSRPPEEIDRLRTDNRLWFGKKGDAIPSLKRFLTEVKDGVVPQTIWFRDEVGDNQDAKKEVKELNADEIFGTPKPEALIRRLLEIATNPGDLVLDSFLGSGTTAAVAHKMGRRWIGIEMGEHAATHCLPRLQKVIDGEPGGISKAVNWTGGGGFRFMKLGAPVFDAHGRIHPEVRFATLAAFVWQQETGSALAGGGWPGTPYLGTNYTIDSCISNEDEGYSPVLSKKTPQFSVYLLFNGILKDKRPASGNVLTQAVLDALLTLHRQIHAASDSTQPADPGSLGGRAFCAGQGGARAAGGGHGAERSAAQAPGDTPTPAAAIPLLVFGEACRLGAARLKLANVTFKHIPYDVKAR